MTRFLMVSVVVAITAAALAAPAGAGRQSDGRGADATEYWTAARVRAAQPAELVLDGPSRPDGEPGARIVPLEAPGDVVDGDPWPDGSGEPVDDLVGKVLFTLGTGDYVCSAGTVAPATGDAWVLLTAGHCTWDDAVGLATNWVFVPDYEDVLQFGCTGPGRDTNEAARCYAATSLHPAAGWVEAGDDYDHDVAFARMDTPPPAGLYDGVDLPIVTTGAAIGVEVQAFGYPASPPYRGSDLVYCQGVPTPGPGSYSSVAELGCDMTGGSSGGSWYADDGAGGRLAVSLNSFRLRGFRGSMFGPVFDSQALDALVQATGEGPRFIAGVGVINPEGDTGSRPVEVPVTLSAPATVPVSVQWTTLDVPDNPKVAHPGSDYVAASGTIEFAPGQTEATVTVEILGDLEDEPPALYGEWGLIRLSNPSWGTVDPGGLFGLGIFVIVDDD